MPGKPATYQTKSAKLKFLSNSSSHRSVIIDVLNNQEIGEELIVGEEMVFTGHLSMLGGIYDWHFIDAVNSIGMFKT